MRRRCCYSFTPPTGIPSRWRRHRRAVTDKAGDLAVSGRMRLFLGAWVATRWGLMAKRGGPVTSESAPNRGSHVGKDRFGAPPSPTSVRLLVRLGAPALFLRECSEAVAQ